MSNVIKIDTSDRLCDVIKYIVVPKMYLHNNNLVSVKVQ